MPAAIPPMKALKDIFFNEDSALLFLQKEGTLPKEKECETCGGPTTLIRPKLLFRCAKKSCRKAVAVRKGTFFAGQCLPLGETLHMAPSFTLICGEVTKELKEFWGWNTTL